MFLPNTSRTSVQSIHSLPLLLLHFNPCTFNTAKVYPLHEHATSYFLIVIQFLTRTFTQEHFSVQHTSPRYLFPMFTSHPFRYAMTPGTTTL
jgi:hypothetical protein